MRRASWAVGGLVAGLLLAGIPAAMAQPPRDGLCDDLVGDALTKCLYSELDDRLRANDMPPTTPSPSQSASPSASATPSAPAKTVVTAAEITADSVVVKWTSTGASGYRVGRDGRDSSCSAACPWSTTDPADATEREFDKLLPDTTYTFFVEPVGGQRVEVTARTLKAASPSPSASSSPTSSPSATPTATPTTQPSGSWLSGASGGENANGTFGAWRGSPSEIAGTWVNSTDLWSLQPGFELGNWQGAIDVAGNVPDWQGWQAEANGVHDGYWRTFAQNLKKYRAGKSGQIYLRLYHEGVGGDWYDWSVRSGDIANYKTAFARTAKIIRAEYPQVKIMLGAAAASGGSRVNVADAWPAEVDVLSIDWYNEWGWCNTKACFDDKIENGAGANSLADLTRLAKSKGVPVLISEWGNANTVRPASSGGGGEAPVVMAAFYDWLKANAGTGPGQVLGEVYFNIDGYDAGFKLYPNTPGPQTAAKYREVWKNN